MGKEPKKYFIVHLIEKESIRNSSYAYVHGNFNNSTKYYGYGGFIMHNNQKYIIQGKGNELYLVEMTNVAGEIIGCQEVAKKAIQLGIRDIDIFYDYDGVKEWATGRWKRNKEGTKQYYYFMQSIKPFININFIKVEGHTRNEGNDEAHKLSKEAVGIKVNSQKNIVNKYDNDENRFQNLDIKNIISNSPLKIKRLRKNIRRKKKFVINNYKSLKTKKINLSIIKEKFDKSEIEN
jgi:ribonuclease HI